MLAPVSMRHLAHAVLALLLLWSGHRALRATTARANSSGFSRPRRFRLTVPPQFPPLTVDRDPVRSPDASRLRRRFRAKRARATFCTLTWKRLALNCTVLEGNRLVSEL